MKIPLEELNRRLLETVAGSRLPGALGGVVTGERLARCRASPQWRDGRFRNEISAFRPVQWSRMVEFFVEHRAGRKPSRPIPSVRRPLAQAPENSLVWLGHSSFFLRLGGLNIAVDPCLHDASPVPGGFRPFPGADRYKTADLPEIDLLLITHDHYDHLDYRTVAGIRSRVRRVLCPLGVGAHFEAWNYDPNRVTELDWRESLQEGDLRITAVPAVHFSGRTLRRNATLWCGFVIETPQVRLYLSGDTGYGPHFAEISRTFGPLDLAVLETGQYDRDWAGIHMQPEDWERALADLQPRAVLPCHNSKYGLARHPWNEPLREALRRSQALGIPLAAPRIGVPVRLPCPDPTIRPWWPDRP